MLECRPPNESKELAGPEDVTRRVVLSKSVIITSSQNHPILTAFQPWTHASPTSAIAAERRAAVAGVPIL